MTMGCYVAQLVERCTVYAEVGGSIPPITANNLKDGAESVNG